MNLPLATDRTGFLPLGQYVGQYRTVGPDGPVYKVLEILDAKYARVSILENEEEVKYLISNLLVDPEPE